MAKNTESSFGATSELAFNEKAVTATFVEGVYTASSSSDFELQADRSKVAMAANNGKKWHLFFIVIGQYTIFQFANLTLLTESCYPSALKFAFAGSFHSF